MQILRRNLLLGLGVAFVAIASSNPAHAEDVKGKWYFGGGIGFLSTTDDIRSNAAIIIGPLGDDGIPFTGDPNEVQSCIDNSVSTFCDIRPDDLLSRETSIEETFKLNLDGGYGLTNWLSLQLDVSYFKGDVGPVDTYLKDHFPCDLLACNSESAATLNKFKDRELVIPVQAGEITEIPVSLSAIARFRKDSPLNPYVGVGFGVIFADMDISQDVLDLNERLSKLHILRVEDEFNNDITRQKDQSLGTAGQIPFRNALQVEVNNSFEWHIAAGAEYFLNDRLSMVFDARYVFADENLLLDLQGEDQVNLVIFTEAAYRPDGSTRYFVNKAEGPNPLCEDVDWQGIGCDPYARPVGQFVNPIAADWKAATFVCAPNDMACLTDRTNWTVPTGGCPRTGDFDRDPDAPSIDKCWGSALPSASGQSQPRGEVVVQGGRINLSGFAAAIGVRFHF